MCSALLGISCIVLFLQIVFRVAGSPLPWSEELGRYMFIWLIYIGSSAAIRERRHISLDLIDLFTGSRVQLIIRIFDNLVFFVFGVILAYYGWLVTLRASHQVSASLRMNMGLAYASISVSGILMVIRLIQDTIRLIRDHKEAEDN